MTARLIDGKRIAQHIQQQLHKTIQQRKNEHKRAPRLDVILVGDNPASTVYVRTKAEACRAVGMTSQIHKLSTDTSQQQIEALIEQCNQNNHCDGILLQLPLPKHLNANLLLEKISIHKDVDGFHPYNLGRLAQGRPALCPCTPHGVMTLLKHYEIDTKGKEAVVVGASNIVGRPMAYELLAANSTVTICHRQTQNLADKIRLADILLAGIGNPHVIQTEWIKPGAVVIDIGFNRLANGKIVGDIDFKTAKEVASFITPVPGGVGPMTVATLLENTLKAQMSLENAHQFM